RLDRQVVVTGFDRGLGVRPEQVLALDLAKRADPRLGRATVVEHRVRRPQIEGRGIERKRPAGDRVAGAAPYLAAHRIHAEPAAELDLVARALDDRDLDADDLAGRLVRLDLHRRESTERIQVALGLQERLHRVRLARRERDALVHRAGELAGDAGDRD